MSRGVHPNALGATSRSYGQQHERRNPVRFVLAIVALVIAIGLAGVGVAQRTILNGSNNLTANVETTSKAAVTVIDGKTLNALPGRQTVTLSGADTIFAAYAPTTDVLAWIGDTTYNDISFDSTTKELTSTTMRGAGAAVPPPAGSDLWLRQYTGKNRLEMPVILADNLSFIVVSDGTASAPSNISIRWPVDNRTPWAGPLIALGGLMLLLSIIFLVWALLHRRRLRGPRRRSISGPRNPRGPRMPKLPRQRSYRVRKPRAIATPRGRRSIRRMIAVVPVLLISGVVLSGCSSDLWPEFGAASSPSASPVASSSGTQVLEDVPAPVATVGQVTAIVNAATSLAATTDASLDAGALAARFAGPALEVRAGNYAVRAKDSSKAAPQPIPTGDGSKVAITLPQQRSTEGEQWPRSIFAVVTSSDSAVQPVALVLIQDSARSQYKVNYAIAITTKLPELPPAGAGATAYGMDTKLLSVAPGALFPAYVDVVNTGSTSASYGLFDITADQLLPQIGPEQRAANAAKVPLATIEVSTALGTGSVVALSSNETGGLIVGSIVETTVAKPKDAGATLNPEGDVKTLTGITGTTKGTTASYTDELLFYVPPITSKEKVTLLGFSQGIVSAKELP